MIKKNKRSGDMNRYISRDNFLREKDMSISTRKSFDTLFRNIEEYEDVIDKAIDEWTKEDCLDMLASLGIKKANTIAVKWSLLKKYLIYIGNTVYREITKSDLENIDGSVLRYIPYEEVILGLDVFENYIDKAIVLLLRNGIRSDEYRLIKHEDIDVENNTIKLSNRNVRVDDYTMDILVKAMNERGYKMNIKDKSNYNYYHYNMESPYLIKNRRNKYNDDGRTPMIETSLRDRTNKLLRRVEIDGISSTALVSSYIVDKIIEFENEMGLTLNENQIKGFVENKLKMKCNMYTIYNMKKNIGE